MNELEKNRIREITVLHNSIVGHLRTTLTEAIRIGELLLAQKAELAHGEFLPWVEIELPFDIREAQRYMRAYRKRDVLNASSVTYLTEAMNRLANRDEAIQQRAYIREQLSARNPESFPDKKYRIIYADPPWPYAGLTAFKYGDVQRHYPPMNLEEIMELPVEDLSEDDSVLFLWTPSPHIPHAINAIDCWDFEYKTSAVWDKVIHNFGYYFSMRHEHLFVATRGSCTPDVKELHDSVISIEKSRKHSEKPAEFRQLIDKLYTWGNRIELFARAPAPGWDTWGNEVPEQVELELAEV